MALSDLKLNSRLVTYLRRCEQGVENYAANSTDSLTSQQYQPWAIERKLSEADIQTIITDFMAGTPKHVLAARYSVSLITEFSRVKDIPIFSSSSSMAFLQLLNAATL